MTSSLKSASQVTSRRYCGTLAENSSAFPSMTKFNLVKTSFICSKLKEVPKRLLILFTLHLIILSSNFSVSNLTVLLNEFASARSLSNEQVKFKTKSL